LVDTVTTPLSDNHERTKVRRLSEKQVTDRSSLNATLDAARVAHIATADAAGQPYVLPVAFGRDGDCLLLHGSTGSRLFRALAAGAPTCVTVTVLDGLVLARSAFESSMHYRSAMVLGTCEAVPDHEVLRCFEVLTEHLMPGRWAQLRSPTAKELAATTLLRMPLVEWSVKVSDGWPDDPAEDLREPVWAGVLPIESGFGTPRPAPDLEQPHEPPSYLAQWRP
jgi:nitroimidazol reductase NimA-like FMN-containing flavoprotein (pyridoxamine 5'-phosphate oxidase superfamily)